MKIKLLPYQHELREALAVNDVVVVRKSRRTGYSWGAGWVATEYAAKQKAEGGMNVYYMGYNLEMAREFIEYVGEDAKYLELGASAIGETLFGDVNDPDNQIQAFRIKFKQGRVISLPSNPRSLRGIQGLLIVDEAAFHNDLAELLKAALAIIMWGGKVLIISTHNGEDNPFNELVEDILAKKLPYKLLTCDFDRAIDEGLYKRICERTGRQWSQKEQDEWREEIIISYGAGADEELFCIPSRTGGAWITRNLIESCMSTDFPVIRFEPPSADFVDWPLERAASEILDWCEEHLKPVLEILSAKHNHFFGEDFGRSGDLTVICPLAELESLFLQVPFILELRNVPFRSQEQILAYVVDRLPRFRGGALDARGNGQALAEFARQKYGADLIAEVMLSQGWYRDNMPVLKIQFEDRTLLIPKHRDILDDLRGLKLKQGIPSPPDSRQNSGSGQRHNDSAVALALALFARNSIESVPWEPPVTAGTSYSSMLTQGFKL
ncbi:terminase large subunit domain-containing protein [Maridesulfovibrio bastinii]|uniref:terminase large subunit domain-containing protein n=1 Tax=Maridesulfovibrio bastinii TaxID=47157 RepID=UPI00041CCE47|nr:terminase family protein [Maridesulfovibrio bastinii]